MNNFFLSAKTQRSASIFVSRLMNNKALRIFILVAFLISAGNLKTFATACAAPVNHATSPSIVSCVSATSFSISWTPASGGATGYVVFRSTTNQTAGTPSAGATYAVGTSYTVGATSGFLCVYSSTGTSFTDNTSLSANTQYWYSIVTYNNTSCTGGPVYNSAGGIQFTNSAAVAKSTPTQSYSSSTSSSITITYSAVSGATGYLISYNTTGFNVYGPNLGGNVPALGTYTNGSFSQTLAYSGAINSPATISGLAAGTTYYITVFAYTLDYYKCSGLNYTQPASAQISHATTAATPYSVTAVSMGSETNTPTACTAATNITYAVTLTESGAAAGTSTLTVGNWSPSLPTGVSVKSWAISSGGGSVTSPAGVVTLTGSTQVITLTLQTTASTPAGSPTFKVSSTNAAVSSSAATFTVNAGPSFSVTGVAAGSETNTPTACTGASNITYAITLSESGCAGGTSTLSVGNWSPSLPTGVSVVSWAISSGGGSVTSPAGVVTLTGSTQVITLTLQTTGSTPSGSSTFKVSSTNTAVSSSNATFAVNTGPAYSVSSVTAGSETNTPTACTAAANIAYSITLNESGCIAGTSTLSVGNWSPSLPSGVSVVSWAVSSGGGSVTSPAGVVTLTGGTQVITLILQTTASTPSGSSTFKVSSTNTAVSSSNATFAVNAGTIPTITLSNSPDAATANVCFSAGGQTAYFNYSATTGSPNIYSITGWSSDAITAGFLNVTDSSLSGGVIGVTVPAGTSEGGTYAATLTVQGSSCVSSDYTITVVVNANPSLVSPGTVNNSCPATTVDLTGISVTDNNSTSGTLTYYNNSTDASAAANAIADATAEGNGTYYIRKTTADGCFDVTSVTVAINSCGPQFNFTVKFFIQGYYLPGGTMSPLLKLLNLSANATDVDTVTIELRSPSDTSLADSYTGILQSNGNLVCTFGDGESGNPYFIVIKHRNSVETWSASAVTMNPGDTYDFSTGTGQAYNSNEVNAGGGVYAIYSGDILRHSAITTADKSTLQSALSTWQTGVYNVNDVTGDGLVDADDLRIMQNDIPLGITAQRHPHL